MLSLNQCDFFYRTGHPIVLTCEVLAGYEKGINILWFNNSGSDKHFYSGRELDLTNVIKTENAQSVTLQYWCIATNSDGSIRSKNVTVFVVSRGW